jgi:hypothetical protein
MESADWLAVTFGLISAIEFVGICVIAGAHDRRAKERDDAAKERNAASKLAAMRLQCLREMKESIEEWMWHEHGED